MLSSLLLFENNPNVFLVGKEYVQMGINGSQARRVPGDWWLSPCPSPQLPSSEPAFVGPEGANYRVYFSRNKEGICPACFGVVVTKSVRQN